MLLKRRSFKRLGGREGDVHHHNAGKQEPCRRLYINKHNAVICMTTEVRWSATRIINILES